MPFQQFPFCIDFLPTGQLIILSASEQPLLRLEADGSFTPHADLSSLKVSNWNEIVVDQKGNCYINGGDILALVTADGLVKKLVEGLSFPNGMAITSDKARLIVAESHGKRLTAFDITNDGNLINRRVWAELNEGVPDGICVDAQDAVWYGDVPNKRCVRVCEGGDILEVVDLEKGCFACALGGPANQTLFMLVAEWRGFASMFDGKRTGQLQAIEVTVEGIK